MIKGLIDEVRQVQDTARKLRTQLLFSERLNFIRIHPIGKTPELAYVLLDGRFSF